MKKNIMTLGAVLLLAIAFSGCRSSGYVSTPGGGYGGGPDPYYQAWYDVYGYQCGTTPGPGCNYYSDGYQIIAVEDPYYSDYEWDNYVAYGYWTFVDTYGYNSAYEGWAWLSPTGILYDEYGWALNEEGQDASRDIIGDVANAEKAAIAGAAKNLTERFSALSDESALTIAKTLNDYATLGKKRHRSEADVADFTKRLYGISMSQAEAAIAKAKNGDLSGLEAANGDIAAHWGTSPETSKEILKSWYKAR